MVLPKMEGYRFCRLCDRYVAINNIHCKLCGVCPSKNGSQYKHCSRCHMCTKPNYRHCSTCNKCVQTGQHSCEKYKQHLRCYICYNKGHAEANCKLVKAKNRRGNCLTCGRNGHTYLNCDQRENLRLSRFIKDN